MAVSCCLVWQMRGYSFICHIKVKFVWQTSKVMPSLPHEKGQMSCGLAVSYCLVWQMRVYSFICHTNMRTVWQISKVVPSLPHEKKWLNIGIVFNRYLPKRLQAVRPAAYICDMKKQDRSKLFCFGLVCTGTVRGSTVGTELA